MDDDTRGRLMYALDDAVTHLEASRGHVAEQEKRIAAAKDSGSDTRGSERLLSTFRECLRLHRMHHDQLLLDLQRG